MKATSPGLSLSNGALASGKGESVHLGGGRSHAVDTRLTAALALKDKR